MLFRGYSYNVPLQKYRQLRRNLSGDACHHSRITKFIKERRVVRSVQVRAFVWPLQYRVLSAYNHNALNGWLYWTREDLVDNLPEFCSN